MWHCRRQEWKLNGCVFEKLVRFFLFESNQKTGWNIVTNHEGIERVGFGEDYPRHARERDASASAQETDI